MSSSLLAELPPDQRQAYLAELSDQECLALLYDWGFWARPDQLLPTLRAWTFWLIKAGRGFGKTRTGAEAVRAWVRNYPLVNLVGATTDDARDIMIEGESGILAICPRGERPQYKKSQRKLMWPNGATSLIFTADRPDRLRGKQHMKVWCDEMAAWRYEESWDQVKLGLRLGDDPQAVITTTPRPIKHIRELIKDPATVVTSGRTSDNFANLARTFIEIIIRKYEGTRLGRQEIDGEVLDDNPNALFQRKLIDDARITPDQLPQLVRIAVAVDPPASSKPDSDLAGIVCGGIAYHPDGRLHGYVLSDDSFIAKPIEWGRRAVRTYHSRRCDRIVAEVNNGGEMVEHVVRTVDQNVSYKAVNASRGKVTRAEPVSALYEQGRIHHVGCFAKLEDEMCDYDPLVTTKSPDRMDALVWMITDLMLDESEPNYDRLGQF